MSPVLPTSTPAANFPDTSSWVLATGLLLGILCLGNFTRLAAAPTPASRQLAPPAQFIHSSERPPLR